MEIREGIDSIRAHISVPEGLTEVRWLGRAKGAATSRVPGPTDLELLAYFPVQPELRESVLASLGPSQGMAERPVPSELAAVLPAAVQVSIDTTPGVRGERFPTTAFENIRWSGGWCIAVEGGLVITMHSH